MRTARPAALAALTAALLGSAPAHAASPALAAPEITCQGRPATVVGSTGTEGDDVMVVVPTAGVTAQALGGNDLICIVAAPEGGIRTVNVDAGPGDDTVVNESADAEDVWYTTVLGAGADSYAGLDADIPDNPRASPFYETVYAGTRDIRQPQVEGLVDTEVDSIDTRGGDDIVWSGSTRSSANGDTVITGAGHDTVHWLGEQTAVSRLDLGDGDNVLGVHGGWQREAAVAVDARTRSATADGRVVLRWSGEVERYELRLDNDNQSFIGTDADETLVLAPTSGGAQAPSAVSVRSVDMGAGDDTLWLYSMGRGTIDGGPGRDHWIGTSCLTARVRIDESFLCVPGSNTSVTLTFGFDDWEDVLVRGNDVSVVGTDASEKVKVDAARVRIRGRGGNDVLNADAPRGSRPKDRAVVVAGGAGADRLVGSAGADRLLGGPGRDRIYGDSGRDEILGGPGRDRAYGQVGRDRCVAEVRRTCER